MPQTDSASMPIPRSFSAADMTRSAIRAHVTQAYLWEKDSGLVAYAMSNDVAQPLADIEEYVLAGAPAGLSETDLFEGVGT